jgi:hypothetical protein
VRHFRAGGGIADRQLREEHKVAIRGEKLAYAVRGGERGDARIVHNGAAHPRATDESRQQRDELLRLAEQRHHR